MAAEERLLRKGRRLGRLGRRLGRLWPTRRARSTLAWRPALGLGVLRVRLDVGRRRRGCAGGFRLRFDFDIALGGFALRPQQRRVACRAWRGLVCGHARIGQPGRLHQVIQRQRKACRYGAIDTEVDGERHRHAIRVSLQRSRHGRPTALSRVRSAQFFQVHMSCSASRWAACFGQRLAGRL